ncbi:hypothetical protein STEG23_004624 [Scotinomys teguina]
MALCARAALLLLGALQVLALPVAAADGSPSGNDSVPVPTFSVNMTGRHNTVAEIDSIGSGTLPCGQMKEPKGTQKPAVQSRGPSQGPEQTEQVTATVHSDKSKGSRFDTGSFVGGIVLTLGVLAVLYIGCKMYYSRRGIRYRSIRYCEYRLRQPGVLFMTGNSRYCEYRLRQPGVLFMTGNSRYCEYRLRQPGVLFMTGNSRYCEYRLRQPGVLFMTGNSRYCEYRLRQPGVLFMTGNSRYCEYRLRQPGVLFMTGNSRYCEYRLRQPGVLFMTGNSRYCEYRLCQPGVVFMTGNSRYCEYRLCQPDNGLGPVKSHRDLTVGLLGNLNHCSILDGYSDMRQMS